MNENYISLLTFDNNISFDKFPDSIKKEENQIIQDIHSEHDNNFLVYFYNNVPLNECTF